MPTSQNGLATPGFIESYTPELQIGHFALFFVDPLFHVFELHVQKWVFFLSVVAPVFFFLEDTTPAPSSPG